MKRQPKIEPDYIRRKDDWVSVLSDRMIVALTVAAILAAVFVYRLQFESIRVDSMAGALENGRLALSALRDHTLRLLDYNDSYLRAVRHEYVEHLSEGDVTPYLKEIAANHTDSYQGALLIGKADGRVAFYTLDSDPAQDNLSGLPYFEFFRTHPQDTLYVEPTRPGRFNPQLRFRLARPILKDGKFFGTIAQSDDPEHFTHLAQSYHLGPHSVAAILHTDHRLIARHPSPSVSGFAKTYDNPEFWRRVYANDSGQYVSRSPVDGVARHILYTTLPGYPIVLYVGISDEDVEADIARAKMLLNVQLMLSIFSTLAACVLVLTILHKNRRMAAAEKIIRDLANTDALTGAKNRRAFLETAEQEFARARRYEQPLSVMMLDADYFKKINDTHGHMVGDIVLQHLVERTRSALRLSDTLGRLGGEEFIVLLPQTTLESAAVVGARVRDLIAGSPIDTPKGPVRLTVSIGIASRTPEMMGFSQIQEAADAALYSAKDEGRNRLVLSRPAPGGAI